MNFASWTGVISFRPLAGCRLFHSVWQTRKSCRRCFRPLTGCGLFPAEILPLFYNVVFPSPCGVWVVSGIGGLDLAAEWFPSPCGVWVVSQIFVNFFSCIIRFRPLAGCGLFWQSCTFFLVQQEKELSTLLFYCIILADGLSIANWETAKCRAKRIKQRLNLYCENRGSHT